MVYGRLGQHGVVLDFRLAQWRAVSGDEDQLGYINKKWKREKGGNKTKVSIGTFSALWLQSQEEHKGNRTNLCRCAFA